MVERNNGVGTVQIAAFNMFGLCLTIALTLQARAHLVLQKLKGDVAGCSRFLATLTLVTGISELLCNPTLGMFGDRYGRRPILVWAAALNMVLKSIVASTGSLAAAGLDAVMSGTMGAVCSSTISAIVTDVSADATSKTLTGRQATIGIAGGLGFVVGPIVGGIVTKKYGARMAYSLASSVAAAQGVFLWWRLPETVETSKPRTHTKRRGRLSTTMTSPLAALKLITGGVRLRWLALIGALQCALEPKAWSNMMMLYMRGHVGLDANTFGRFSASFAVASMFAKGWVKFSSSRFGAQLHTSGSNLMSAFAFMVWGASHKPWASFFALACAPFHIERRRTVMTAANRLATVEGIGNGEFEASFSNIRSVVVMTTALVLGQVQAANASHRPGLAFRLLGVIALVAELVHQVAIRNCRNLYDDDDGIANSKHNDNDGNLNTKINDNDGNPNSKINDKDNGLPYYKTNNDGIPDYKQKRNL